MSSPDPQIDFGPKRVSIPAVINQSGLRWSLKFKEKGHDSTRGSVFPLGVSDKNIFLLTLENEDVDFDFDANACSRDESCPLYGLYSQRPRDLFKQNREIKSPQLRSRQILV